MAAPEPGTEIDGFRLGERITRGRWRGSYRVMGNNGPLPLIVNPRLGPGERP